MRKLVAYNNLGIINMYKPIGEVLKNMSDNEHLLREMLFAAHGDDNCNLYGDDGERHCNSCMIDFIRDTPKEIEQKIYENNLKKYIREKSII